MILLIFSNISYSGNSLNQIIQEKEKNIKYLISLSDGNLYGFWIGILIVDMIKYLIFVIITFSFLKFSNFSFFVYLIPISFFLLHQILFLFIFIHFLFTNKNKFKHFII